MVHSHQWMMARSTQRWRHRPQAVGDIPLESVNPPEYLTDYTEGNCDEDDSSLISMDYSYRAVFGIPPTFKEAMASTESEKWKRAMDEEIQSWEDNHTFTLTTLPEGRKTVGGRWVYSIKLGSDGHDQYKAWFVVKGYSQGAGIDYGEMFLPTANLTGVRVVMQKVAQDNLILHQMDVKTAYLHAPIDRDI